MPPLLVDTGALYAMADRDDEWHSRMVRFLGRSREELLVPVSVLPEAAYLLATHLGPEAERKLIWSVVAGEMAVEELTIQDLRRTLELLSDYEAARIGFVDATVVATAERLRISRILTTDRRDFSLVRPRHCRAFELLP
ncbi:MAG: type II toxin-antitoxin system VapC family toxin [Candidatus Rokuibacteriota bacterium]